MSQIKSIGIASIVAVCIVVLAAGCSKSDNIFNPETGKHAANWANPDVHGASAMGPAGSSGGLSTCQECHGSDFSGGISSIACSSCHGGSAPHPVSWTTGTRKHSSTDQSNAEVCAVCHANGANSPIAPPVPPAPAGTAPGCFNNTLCHGQAGHAAGWSDPAATRRCRKAGAGRLGHGRFQRLPDLPRHQFRRSRRSTSPASRMRFVTAQPSPRPIRRPPGARAGAAQGRTRIRMPLNATVCADCHTLGAHSDVSAGSDESRERDARLFQ